MNFDMAFKMGLNFVLRSGWLDASLAGISGFAESSQQRIADTVTRANLIWRHKVALGVAPREGRFADFLSEYINSIISDAVAEQPINVPRVTEAVLKACAGMIGSNKKFWMEALGDLKGFTTGSVGSGLGETIRVSVEELKPILFAIRVRLAADYEAAVQWKSLEVNPPG